MSVPSLLVLFSDDRAYLALLEGLDRSRWAVARVRDPAQLPSQLGAAPAGTQVVALCDEAWLAARWPAGMQALPCPVSLIGPPPTEGAELLLAKGVTGWWPPAVLASPTELAAALAMDAWRWQHERGTRAELARIREQLDDRKWVDRAKGVLMNARALSEDEAFRLLRGAAMHANLRVGEVSRSIIEAAQWAEAVNRAGQLRMLSQRLLKLAAQRVARVDAKRAHVLQQAATQRAQDNLDHLAAMPALTPAEGAGPAQAFQQAQAAWAALADVLAQRPTPALLSQADGLGEALCTAAEALTEQLQACSGRRVLHLVNLCGRQRMHVQRLAKQWLLSAVLDEPDRRAALTPMLEAFEAALVALAQAPLSSPEIREALSAAQDEWLRLLQGLRSADGAESRALLSRSSDALLDHFDRLTEAYEHSLQVIMS